MSFFHVVTETGRIVKQEIQCQICGDPVTKDGVWVNIVFVDDYACKHCASRGQLKEDYQRVVSISLASPVPTKSRLK